MNILSFGEVLWDVYPDKEVIGGAPFNFSAHMAKLGAHVDLLTAIGKDERGVKALDCINGLGVSDALVRLSPYPTGACFVTTNDQGSPSYELRYDMAYDHITLGEEQREKLSRSSYQAFYFGTLAQRHEESRKTVNEILSHYQFPHIFFDINIRQNWYNRTLLEQGLHFCTILKVSREEASVFEETGLTKTLHKQFPHEDAYFLELCRELTQRYEIATVLFTLDKDGAMIYDARPDSVYYSEKPKGKVVSTVGAGDSFSACFLYHYMKGIPMEQCLHKAIVLSDYVVQHIEAIPPYSEELLAQLTL